MDIRYIAEHPEDWDFISTLIKAVCCQNKANKAISMRGFEPYFKVSYHTIQKRIDQIYSQFDFSKISQSVLKDFSGDFSVKKIVCICNLVICNNDLKKLFSLYFSNISQECSQEILNLRKRKEAKEKENILILSDDNLNINNKKGDDNNLSDNKLSSDYISPTKEPSGSFLTINDVVDLWNSICGSKLPKVIKLTDSRRQTIKCRIEDSDGKDVFIRIFSFIAKTPFYCGENNNNWKAEFDWVMKSSNFVKLMEKTTSQSAMPSAQSPLTQASAISSEIKALAVEKIRQMHPKANTPENIAYIESMLVRYPYAFGHGLPIVFKTSQYFIDRVGEKGFEDALNRIENEKPEFASLASLLNEMTS